MRLAFWLHFATLLFALTLTVPSQAEGSRSDPAPGEISQADFFVEGLAPVRKSGPYDVTIIYFMDYQCPACRQYTPDVARVLNEDRKVRVIYRDTPLLGPRSDAAARAAIASHFQGRHEAFHHALMTTKGPVDDTAIRAAAAKAGINWARLQRDLASRTDEIDAVIARNLELAEATGISGTPAFIVGERQSNGALKYELLKAEIADARKALAGRSSTRDPNSDRDIKSPIAESQIRIQPTSPKQVEVGAAVAVSKFEPSRQTQGRMAAETNPEGNSDRRMAWAWLTAIALAIIGFVAMWATKFRRA